LKSIPPPAPSEDTKNTFWNSCPRKLGYFPDSVCPLGKISAETRDAEKGCPWFVNSEQDHYCFWTFIRRVSDKDGFMEPLLQHEMATLLNSSGAKLHASYKEAVEKMKALPEFEDLKNLFGD